MNLDSLNNMKNMICGIQFGEEINKLTYLCIEECQC